LLARTDRPESEIDEVHDLVVRMFALVSEGLTAATDAFLNCDRPQARAVVARDQQVDELLLNLEALVEDRLVNGTGLDAAEVRLLISVLRIAPELERSGDLIEHIALRTPQRLTADLPARARGLLAQMGAVAVTMWRSAADAYIERDPDSAARLRICDDTLDDLHVELTQELATAGTSIAAAIELGLIARFYERLGDHAVNVARRVRYLTDG
jgi:phosphate transport system protein